MKNKNLWKLLRCIGIAPWQIFTGEQRFIFDGRDGGTDAPDGGASGESEDGDAEAEDTGAGEAPADTETSARAAAQRSVETGQGGLVRNAALTHESSQQYLRRLFESLPPALKDDDETQKAYLSAHTDLDLANTVEDRVAIIEDLQAQIDNYDLSRYAPAADDENAPPPTGEAEEEGEAEILPPAAATEGGAGEAPAAHTEAAPKRPALSAERRGELTQDFVLNQRPDGQKRIVPKGEVTAEGFKKVFAVDISGTDKRSREAIKAAVWSKQESLNAALKKANKQTIKVDGIFGPETFLAIKEVDAPTLAQLKEAAPAAAPAASAVVEAVPAAPPPAVAEAAAPLPDLSTVSRPTFRNSAELKDSNDYRSPDKYDEYTAQVGDILVLDTDIKDADGNTVFKEGLPVMVTALGERKEDKNITLEVATAEGKPIQLTDGKTRLSAADQLDNPDAEDIQEFVRQKNTHAQALWQKARLDDVDNMYRREVVFTTDATDDGGKRIAAGTVGISQWTSVNGYTVTVGENVYHFKGVEVGCLPVKDKSFDSATGQYAKLRTGGRIFIYHRGEKSGASMPIPVRDGEVVLVLGKTNDGYKVRTSWGGEGFITNASLNEGTRVARSVGQPIETVLAAVEAKAAPAPAIAAIPAAAPPAAAPVLPPAVPPAAPAAPTAPAAAG